MLAKFAGLGLSKIIVGGLVVILLSFGLLINGYKKGQQVTTALASPIPVATVSPLNSTAASTVPTPSPTPSATVKPVAQAKATASPTAAPAASPSPAATASQPAANQDDPPKLKNIGFNLDHYDAATKRAGDFHFTQELAKVLSGDPIYRKLIWSDYGIQDNRSPNDPTKRNVQPTFYLPLGTKVLAPIDGVVTNVEVLYSNDYTIWFANNQKSTWFYEMEHVLNPAVKVGDKVTAGQVVAEVSTHNTQNHPGFGIVELGLFHQLNNEPAHWCPFVHLDDSIKDEVNKKILGLYAAWEAYLGDDSVYNNASYPVPGCATLDPSKG